MTDTTRDETLDEVAETLIEAQKECQMLRDKLGKAISPDAVKVLSVDYRKAYDKFRRLFRDFIALKEELREDQ